VWSNYEKRYTILKTWAEAQFSPQRGEYGKNSSSDEPDVLTPEGSAPTKKPKSSLTTAAANNDGNMMTPAGKSTQFSSQRSEYDKNSSFELDIDPPPAAPVVDQYLALIMALSSQSDSWKSTQTVVTVDPKDIQGGGELIMSHNLKVRKRFFQLNSSFILTV
jgi:hypothetical protein